MKSFRAVVVVILFAVPFGHLLGGEANSGHPPKYSGWRRHFEIKGDDGTALYEVTQMVRMSDVADEQYLLVRDEGHGDFVIRKVWNFETQAVQHRISDLKDRAFLQLVYKMPFTSRTRLETLAEARTNPDILPQVNTVFTLESNGGTWEGTESEWLSDPTRLRALRHSIRSTVDRFILEAIERGRGVLFATSEGQPFYRIAGRYAVYDSDTATNADDPEPARASTPDCAFDAAFGYPCSEKQKAFIKKAANQGVVPDMY